jgi:hypothetical protein
VIFSGNQGFKSLVPTLKKPFLENRCIDMVFPYVKSKKKKRKGTGDVKKSNGE